MSLKKLTILLLLPALLLPMPIYASGIENISIINGTDKTFTTHCSPIYGGCLFPTSVLPFQQTLISLRYHGSLMGYISIANAKTGANCVISYEGGYRGRGLILRPVQSTNDVNCKLLSGQGIYIEVKKNIS